MAVRERELTQDEIDDWQAWREAEKRKRAQDRPQPKEETEPQAKAHPRRRMVELGALAIAFGAPLWWFAATNTLNGFIRFFNIVLDRLSVPLIVPTPHGWWVLTALVVGWVFSRSEITHLPIRRTKKGIVFYGFFALLTWLIVIATDIGAQFLGSTDVPPTAWALEQWVANTLWAAAGWSVVLTFIPDRMILWGAQQTGLDWLLARIGIR